MWYSADCGLAVPRVGVALQTPSESRQICSPGKRAHAHKRREDLIRLAADVSQIQLDLFPPRLRRETADDTEIHVAHNVIFHDEQVCGMQVRVEDAVPVSIAQKICDHVGKELRRVES